MALRHTPVFWHRALFWGSGLVLTLLAGCPAPEPPVGDATTPHDSGIHDSLTWVDASTEGGFSDRPGLDMSSDAGPGDRNAADLPGEAGSRVDSNLVDSWAGDSSHDGGLQNDGGGDGDARTDGGPLVTQGMVVLDAGLFSLQLTVLEPGVVRLRYLSGTAQHDRGWTTVPTAWPDQPIVPDDLGDRWRINTGELSIEVDRTSLRFLIVDSRGHELCRATGVDPLSSPRLLSAALHADEHFVGFGEKTGRLDKRGQRLEMWTADPWYPEPTFSPSSDPIYQSHPFFITLREGRAHGLYLNNTHRSRFDLGATEASTLGIEVDAGELDLVLFNGPSVPEVVRRYTALTGRTALPPLWALGYHQCRWSYAPESEVRQVVDQFIQRDIPLDGVWLDIDYMDGFRSFTWDPSGFADPAGLISDLEALGVKTTVIIDPGIKHQPGGGYAVFDDGLAGAHFVTLPSGEPYVGLVWPGDAVFPDFTRPATRGWWAAQVAGLMTTGIRGVWIDMNEPTTWQTGGFPLDTRFDGEGVATDHRETRNVYALLMARATRHGMQQGAPGRRPFVLTRSGFAGIQREAAVWTGDAKSEWGHLAMAPAMLGNLGLSGVGMVGSDVGGFSGNPGGELFVRWMALGAVSPFFRAHVMTGAPRQEPWSFGVEIEAISRALIRQRYELLPYVYSLAHNAADTGAPLLRPLVYDFQEDALATGIDDQLMLGPALLVAPVVGQGVHTRQVHLPTGTWVEWDTGRRHEGGGSISVEAPIHRLPVLARANAIVPLWPAQRHVGAQVADPLYLELFAVPDQPAQPGFVVLDDGESPGQDAGVPYRQGMVLSATATRATLQLAPEQGSFVPQHDHLWLRFRGVASSPTAVHLDAVPLSEVASVEALSSTQGWWHDAAAQVVHVRLPRQPAGAIIDLDADLVAVQGRQVALTLRVALPTTTPTGDTVYLASDLGGWVPDAQPMARSGDWAEATTLVTEGQHLLFKFTRGTWASVETGSACEELSNRDLVVIGDRDARQVHITKVDLWRGVDCP
ncbi:MAG: TIM-barrel domain-containing protein [Pseudomonadota bacterium]